TTSVKALPAARAAAKVEARVAGAGAVPDRAGRSRVDNEPADEVAPLAPQQVGHARLLSGEFRLDATAWVTPCRRAESVDADRRRRRRCRGRRPLLRARRAHAGHARDAAELSSHS